MFFFPFICAVGLARNVSCATHLCLPLTVSCGHITHTCVRAQVITTVYIRSITFVISETQTGHWCLPAGQFCVCVTSLNDTTRIGGERCRKMANNHVLALLLTVDWCLGVCVFPPQSLGSKRTHSRRKLRVSVCVCARTSNDRAINSSN